MKKVLATLLAVAVPALVLAALASPVAAQAASEQADIIDFGFAPVELTVDSGTSVTWTNQGARPHTVTDRGGTFDTNSLAPGESGTITFTVPGRYYFFCRINPVSMNGVLVVGGDDEAPVVRIQATDEARDGDSLSFDPSELTVSTGTTISFANVGGKPHTLTAADGSFDTGVVTPGAQNGRFAGTNATVTVTRPGSFAFRCEVHPAAMQGTLTVLGDQREGAAAASDAPRNVQVETLDFSFDPFETSIAPGGRATWVNAGEAPHTATFDDVDLDTGNIAPGEEGTLTLPQEPGTYSYRCDIHPGRMRGVMVVLGSGIADPAGADEPRAGGVVGEQVVVRDPISGLALATGVLGAFFGGLGIAFFLAGRRKPPPQPPAPEREPAQVG